MATSTVRHAKLQARSITEHLTPLGISAILLMLAFPEPGWGWLAHIALAPAVWVAIRSSNSRHLAWTSYAVALVWWLIRISWMTPVTIGGYFALTAYSALYFSSGLLLVRHLDTQSRLPLTLTVPMVWVSLDVIRTYFPAGGFTWFSLAHSQASYLPDHDLSRIIQIADIFGEHGVTFLVAMTNGLIADFATQPWPASCRLNRKLKFLTALWLIVFISAYFYGYYRIRETNTSSDQLNLNVVVIQTNVPQDNKNHPTLQQIEADWVRMMALSHQAVEQCPTAQLIVWPETMVPTALNRETLAHYQASSSERDRFHKDIQNFARTTGVHMLVGAHAYYDWKNIPTVDGQGYYQIPGKRFNAVYHYRPDGSQAPHRYDKIHRVPFGEYIPWVERVPILKKLFIKYLSPYEVDYTLRQGESWTIFSITTNQRRSTVTDHSASRFLHSTKVAKVTRIATPICFEDAVARVTRQMVYSPEGDKRADLLVNLTNDGWYADTHEGPQHFQIATFRCIETRTPMARCVNTGISGFIDSVGRVGPLVKVHGQHQNVEGFVASAVQYDSRCTWFSRLGHIPAIVLACMTVALIITTKWLAH